MDTTHTHTHTQLTHTRAHKHVRVCASVFASTCVCASGFTLKVRLQGSPAVGASFLDGLKANRDVPPYFAIWGGGGRMNHTRVCECVMKERESVCDERECVCVCDERVCVCV